MPQTLIRLENDFWQTAILPDNGTSIAYGRAHHRGTWVDVMRPTAEADYGNSSNCSSFLMLPWANRIGGGILRFQGQDYVLEKTPDDGTARHGDVRRRQWVIEEQSATHIRLSLDSRQHTSVNFPFAFSVVAEYRLADKQYIWSVSLTNEDSRPFPAGFGHHPYFVRPDGAGTPEVLIPCDQQFNLTGPFLATTPPVPVTSSLDFRQFRALDASEYNNLLTARHNEDAPARIRYPQSDAAQSEIELVFEANGLFKHWLLYTPAGKPYFALEPQTNANDGFNLAEQGYREASGVFVLQPGETKSADVRLWLSQH